MHKQQVPGWIENFVVKKESGFLMKGLARNISIFILLGTGIFLVLFYIYQIIAQFLLYIAVNNAFENMIRGRPKIHINPQVIQIYLIVPHALAFLYSYLLPVTVAKGI